VQTPLTKLSKFFIYTGISILFLAALVVGAYYYTLNRYAGEIDALMDIFLAEMLEEESKDDISRQPAADHRDDMNETGSEKAAETDSETAPGKDGINNEPGSAPGASDNTGNRTPGKDDKSEPAPTEDNKEDGLQELEKKYAPAFKNVELKDQAFTLQMLRKFSVDELQQMFRLYQAGGESRAKLLTIMEQKITPEELERIKEVAMKYKGLL